MKFWHCNKAAPIQVEVNEVGTAMGWNYRGEPYGSDARPGHTVQTQSGLCVRWRWHLGHHHFVPAMEVALGHY